MDPNPFTESIERTMNGQANFFWDAFAALQVNGITGDYAEFGCHRGGSFSSAYKALSRRVFKRHMWAFDSGSALPDDHPRDLHPGWELGGANAGGIGTFHKAPGRLGVPRDAYTDDYYCWTASDISGERSALHEFLTAHPEWNFFRYKDIHWGRLSFVVERADALSRQP